MKSNLLITALLAISTLAGTRTLNAQGSLTPPAGPPTVTSHTLNEIYDKAAAVEGSNADQTTKIDSIKTRVDKVDGRIALVPGAPGVSFNNGYSAISIGLPGSYYLTGNIDITGTTLSNGITISADVTLDLNGFSVICKSANGNIGVSVGSSGGGNYLVHIKNGTIRGGITLTGTTFGGTGWRDGLASGSVNTHVSDVSVFGVLEAGIDASIGTVERCLVDTCKEEGITASSVIDSNARRCGRAGIRVTGNSSNVGLVKNSFGEAILSGPYSGIVAFSPGQPGGVVTHSIGISNTSAGIVAGTVSHSKGISTSGTGIDATETVDNSTGISASGPGIETLMATNCTAKSTSGSAAMYAATASFCRGTRPNGTAIAATTAIGCSTGGGTITATQKHLGTP